MHQFEESQADEQEQDSLCDFEPCDQRHAGVVLFRHRVFMFIRVERF